MALRRTRDQRARRLRVRVAQHELLASNAVLTRKMLGVAVANGVALQQSEAAAAARPSEKAADVVVAAFNGRIANHLAAERDAKAAMHARTFARTRVLETLVEVPRADDIHHARLHAAEWPARHGVVELHLVLADFPVATWLRHVPATARRRTKA